MFTNCRIGAWPALIAAGAASLGLSGPALGQVSLGTSVRPTVIPPIPRGDYGDAPDGTPAHYPAPYAGVIGNFPTRFATSNSRYGLSGAYTSNTTQERLGARISIERGPRDLVDPDSIENLVDDDFDDGMIGGPCPAGAPPVPFPALISSILSFDVEIAAGAPAGTRYINVLLDRNLDGVWSNSPGNTEWVAIDVPVNIAPGSSGTVTVGPIAWPVSAADGWMRVALTRSAISGSFPDDGSGWDGSGTFASGEIEDYLPVSTLAYASDAAGASDSAARFASAAAAAAASANPPDAVDLVAIDVTAYASAVASAHASATASAAAIATAVAEAGAYESTAAGAAAAAIANAASIAAACVTCPCATLCAAAGANATAAVLAATEAHASASAVAAAAASAAAYATAHVDATVTASAEITVHVSAFAAAIASAQAEATASASAQASAAASAASAASASAAALAAACAGDARAAAAAAAQASAYAQAAAQASASATAHAQASAFAWADARIVLQLMIRTQTSAEAAAAAATFAGSAASAYASSASHSEAAALAAAASIGESFAMVMAACSGDCCPPPNCTTPDNYRDGTTASGAARTGTGATTFTLVGVRVRGGVVVRGFRWQSVDMGAGGFVGLGDVSIWSADIVSGGGAMEGNAMFSASSIPTQRQPVTTDCGQPVQMFGQPVFEYTMMLSQPMTLPEGQDVYVGVRGVGDGPYNSRVLSAFRDSNEPAMPSYYLAPSEGFPSAVPVSEVLNCDHDFVVQTISG